MNPENIQIVIPMSGEGSRFQKAGYPMLKPLIPVGGRPIIDWVISLFPGHRDLLLLCRDTHLAETELGDVLSSLAPHGRIIPVKGAKKGPVYAVSQVFADIEDTRPVIVCYCDFFQRWDYADFVRNVTETDCDGAIPCYKGFHPHLLHAENFYASCRTTPENKVLEIREKYSFTPNKQDSPQSSGIYYFRSGALMKQYFQRLLEEGPALNGEYYASLVYTHMIEDGLDIRVYDQLTHFCQWGTPQDLEEYQYWEAIFSHRERAEPSPARPIVAQKLIPMAGAGSRFAKAGYTLPKPLIPVNHQPMALAATRALPTAERNIFVCQREHLAQSALESLFRDALPDTHFLAIDGMTEGQASTCLLAKELLSPEASLVIGACDNGMQYDRQAFQTATETADCLVFTFRKNPTVVHKPEQYGWVEVGADGTSITRVSVKKPISQAPLHDHAVVGAFWFRKAGIFLAAAERMLSENRRINGEFYVDELVNDVIALGNRAHIFEIDHYICWGTPDDLQTYEYWQQFFQAA